MNRTAKTLLSLTTALATTAACTSDNGDAEDGENDVAVGKSDAPTGVDAADIVAFVNDGGTDVDLLDVDVGLSTRVATAIIKRRDGSDRKFGTRDDKPFGDLDDLDTIKYLGPVAMKALQRYARANPSDATLRVDLIAQERVASGPGGWRDVPLASLNSALAAHGISFPERLTLGQRDGAKFNKVLEDLAKANRKLHREIDFEFTWDPSDYKGLCYAGPLTGIARTVEGLRDSLFSVYMGVQAERFETKKLLYYGGDTEREWLDSQREENGEIVEVWEQFDTSSDDYLMMTDGGQQGDGLEFFAVTIKPCT